MFGASRRSVHARACRSARRALCSLAVAQHPAQWQSPIRHPPIEAWIVAPEAPATEWCLSTGRCSRRRAREPQPPAGLLNWSGSPRTLTVPVKCASGVGAPIWRRSLLAYWFACWPSSSSSGSAPRLSRCLHHHKPGARGQAGRQPEGSVDMDNSASFAGEVERNVSPDNDFSLRG
jgi:hypothetical protein